MTFLRAALLMLVTVGPAAAQTRPDFTGRWARAESSGVTDGWDLADEITVREVVVDRRVTGAPMSPGIPYLDIERRTGGAVRVETVTIGIRGGVVGGISGPAERSRSRSEYAAEWKGERLLIWTSTTDIASDGSERTHERAQEWSIDAEGRLVIAVTTKQSGGNSRRGRLIYRRAP